MTGRGDLAGWLTRRLGERLPAGVKRRLAGPYNRVQIARADREFRGRDLPTLDPAVDAPRHVVCVVVDALRADAIDPGTTPYLADRHVGSAVTPAPWTFPAVASLVTGQYPHEHGAMRTSDDADCGATDLVLPPDLPADRQTLPEVFAAAGYDTYGGFAFHMPFFALGGRFETHALYDDAPAASVLDDFADWFAPRDDERTFSYLHLGDLHEPVDPPARYWDAHDVDGDVGGLSRWRYETDSDPGPEGKHYREHRRRLYSAAADYVDDRLAALADVVTGRDDVALVVTADHGEALWEWTAFDAARFVDSRPAHGVDHGGTPYESGARVPLVLDGLDGEADGPVSLVDLAPTLLDSLGHPDAIPTTGYTLATAPPEDRVLLTEAARYGHEKKAVYQNEWKLLVSKGDDRAVGFRVPDEEPVQLPDPVERRLTEALPAWPDGDRPEQQVSGVARDRLEDLGYV